MRVAAHGWGGRGALCSRPARLSVSSKRRQSKSHGSLAAIVYVIIGLRTHFWLRTCLPRITHILFSWTISVVLAHHKQFIRVNCMPSIAHTLIWLTVSIVLANHTQFILVNCMPYIAHTLIWLPISVVLPHLKQFCWINRLPHITHATLIWIVFDVTAIANVLYLFWWFYYITICD
jgi:hypothetical protein